MAEQAICNQPKKKDEANSTSHKDLDPTPPNYFYHVFCHADEASGLKRNPSCGLECQSGVGGVPFTCVLDCRQHAQRTIGEQKHRCPVLYAAARKVSTTLVKLGTSGLNALDSKKTETKKISPDNENETPPPPPNPQNNNNKTQATEPLKEKNQYDSSNKQSVHPYLRRTTRRGRRNILNPLLFPPFPFHSALFLSIPYPVLHPPPSPISSPTLSLPPSLFPSYCFYFYSILQTSEPKHLSSLSQSLPPTPSSPLPSRIQPCPWVYPVRRTRGVARL